MEILPHWPFFAAAIIFGVVGKIVKRLVPASNAGWKFWFRRSLPAHPILAGLGLGLIPGMPISPGVENTAGHMAYFALAGALSTNVYDFIRHWIKSRGIKLSDEGSTTPPPPT